MRTTLLILSFLLPLTVAAQVEGWKLFVDPGHSQTENQGAFGYSEAHKVLRVGLNLREMFLTRTDIDTVYMSRTNDQENVPLTQRPDMANELMADYYHSIHSNAGGPSANSLFVLWPQCPDGTEGEPNGGRAMAEHMGPVLAAGMRIPTSNDGAWGECDFYGASTCRSPSVTPKCSRNYVQSFSNMPSTLSEAGFHTNPTQNQRNMSPKEHRLEAQAMYWAILDIRDVERTPERIATGIFRDAESGQPINGAIVTVDGQPDTTDTWESLFHQWSDDPDELRNGLYYLEDLDPGTLSIEAEAEDYHPYANTVTMNEADFTFHDVELLSSVPPTVTATIPEEGETQVSIYEPLTIDFSRPMDPATTEAAFSLAQGGSAVSGTFEWLEDNYRLRFTPDAPLDTLVLSTLEIAGEAEGQAGDPIDGNGDGTGGDAFVLTFTTGHVDAEAPGIVSANPPPFADGVELLPVVTLTYNERVLHESLEGRAHLLHDDDEVEIPTTLAIYDVGDQSVFSLFPEGDLAADTRWRVLVDPGVEDHFGNVRDTEQSFTFRTGTEAVVITGIDDFEADVTSNWWEPAQSGSTTGTIPDTTFRVVDNDVFNQIAGGEAAMRTHYGWDTEASSTLIRQHLHDEAPPYQVVFDSSQVLQAYVFGDGSGNLFRFNVDDNTSAEVSPWIEVDWKGWRLVSWDFDETGPWVGDGVVDPPLRFDSFHLRWNEPDGAVFGSIVFDDLRVVDRVTIDDDTGPIAGGEALRVRDPAPNPFSGTTRIRFVLGEAAEVSVSVYDVLGRNVTQLLDQEPLSVGDHDVEWDADGLAAGTYVIHVQAGNHSETVKALVVR